MHSYHGDLSNFHYNGDFSGEVIIAEKLTEEEWAKRQREGIEIPEIEIPSEFLLKFVSDNRFLIDGEVLLFNGTTNTSDFDIHVTNNRMVSIVSNNVSIASTAKELVEFVCFCYVQSELVRRAERMELEELIQKLPELIT